MQIVYNRLTAPKRAKPIRLAKASTNKFDSPDECFVNHAPQTPNTLLEQGGTDIIFQTRSFLINIHGTALRLQCSPPQTRERFTAPSSPAAVGRGRCSENDPRQILEILACSETVCGLVGGFPSWFLWLWLETFQFMGRTRGFLRLREKKF